MKIRLEKGTLEDLVNIVPLQEELFGIVDTGLSPSKYVDWVWKWCDALLIARDNSNILGYSFYKAIPCYYESGEVVRGKLYSCQKPDCDCNNSLFIMDIGVKKDYQREGIATMLLEEIIKEAEEKGRNKIFLQSWNGSPDNASYNFFKKHGFKEHVYINGYYSDGGDARIMCREI